MRTSDHVRQMAAYNAWMNVKLYAAATQLSDETLGAARGAFFGSIIGTLNHIVVGDTIWLKRFATHPARYSALLPLNGLPHPGSLDQIMFGDIRELAAHRTTLDGMISDWAAAVTDADLEHVLHYANTRGVVSDKRFFNLVMHFFNHQTHHRGQATTLLSQSGVDIGVTDLLALIPNEVAA